MAQWLELIQKLPGKQPREIDRRSRPIACSFMRALPFGMRSRSCRTCSELGITHCYASPT